MAIWIWIVISLISQICALEDPLIYSGGGPFPPFSQTSFFNPMFSRMGMFGFGPRFSFKRPGQPWNVNGGDMFGRMGSQAMCARNLSPTPDETRINECVNCFEGSEMRKEFSRSYNLSTYSTCAKTYLGNEYSPCFDDLQKDNSGKDASAIDVYKFRGCVDYTHWTKSVNECQQQYPENQFAFYQCVNAAKRIPPQTPNSATAPVPAPAPVPPPPPPPPSQNP